MLGLPYFSKAFFPASSFLAFFRRIVLTSHDSFHHVMIITLVHEIIITNNNDTVTSFTAILFPLDYFPQFSKISASPTSIFCPGPSTATFITDRYHHSCLFYMSVLRTSVTFSSILIFVGPIFFFINSSMLSLLSRSNHPPDSPL